MEKSATVSGPVIFHYTADPQDLRTMAQNLFRMVASDALRVAINQRFPLSQVADVHREGRGTNGLTILLP